MGAIVSASSVSGFRISASLSAFFSPLGIGHPGTRGREGAPAPAGWAISAATSSAEIHSVSCRPPVISRTSNFIVLIWGRERGYIAFGDPVAIVPPAVHRPHLQLDFIDIDAESFIRG